MVYYINSISSSNSELDLKTLIPDANMRRRMSPIIKMGVSAAMDCLTRSSELTIDAIITATGLGCLADSEKFLKTIIENNEQLLNPTPFIQSTFNTIGGQIALITSNHCYNMTYSHREASFESALLDAIMLLNEGAENILIGSADEMTPTQVTIMKRLGAFRNGTEPAEGAHFFIISRKPTTNCLAILETLIIDKQQPQGLFDKEIVASKSYHTASADALYNSVLAIQNGAKKVLIRNNDFKIVLRCQ